MQTVHMPVTLRVNGEDYPLHLEPRRTLLDTLRDTLGLTGSKKVCDMGQCGACTVLCDGVAVYACLKLTVESAHCEITTIEGLADGTTMHPVQQAFQDNHGLQCGFCTPGMVMAAVSLLDENPHPTEREVREGIEGNLCRCTGYHNIVQAVLAAADGGGGG